MLPRSLFLSTMPRIISDNPSESSTELRSWNKAEMLSSLQSPDVRLSQQRPTHYWTVTLTVFPSQNTQSANYLFPHKTHNHNTHTGAVKAKLASSSVQNRRGKSCAAVRRWSPGLRLKSTRVCVVVRRGGGGSMCQPQVHQDGDSTGQQNER